jgi:2-dehydro-3-deoxyphosphogluconate aldolase/(4S)-4-hydroxy-2-oxoglutarate aldolase
MSGVQRLRTALTAFPVVAIMRAADGRHLVGGAEALASAGVTAIEVTATTPGAYAAAAAMRAHLDPGIAIGVGTVTETVQLAAVTAAGCDFIVSPHTDASLIRQADGLGLGILPGAMTPTEVLAAARAGATGVKLFPAGGLGLGFLRAVRDPLPDVSLVPTGGIAVESVPAWLAAGAYAVGMGSPLLGDALHTGDFATLRARVARLRHILADAGRVVA